MNHIAGRAEFVRTFGVSRETADRVERYAQLLLQWQPTINLVAPSTLSDVWHRHFADSAQLLPLAPPGPLHWLDLGSGGGFPGLVVGCMLAERGGCRLTLVESDVRKSAFLREVVRQIGLAAFLAVDIVTDRIENTANTTRVGAVDVISARALAPLDRLFSLILPYFGADTMALLPKGGDAESEKRVAEASWVFDSTLVFSQTSDAGRVVCVRNLRQRYGEDASQRRK